MQIIYNVKPIVLKLMEVVHGNRLWNYKCFQMKYITIKITYVINIVTH